MVACREPTTGLDVSTNKIIINCEAYEDFSEVAITLSFNKVVLDQFKKHIWTSVC